jgi:hypothetical protein
MFETLHQGGSLAWEYLWQSTLFLGLGRFETLFPQGLATLDLADEAEPKPVDITVRKGVTLEARAIGPDGKVVTGLVGLCEGIDAKLIGVRNHGRAFDNGLFRLPGADPARTYRIYLVQPERRIGAVVDLKPDPQSKQPFEVKLQPTAKVHGTVTGTGGAPIAEAHVSFSLVFRDKDGVMTRDEMYRNTVFYSSLLGQMAAPGYSARQRSNAQGKFAIDTLLPGARLYLIGAAGRREARVPVQPLEPGEDRDLGAITLKEREP